MLKKSKDTLHSLCCFALWSNIEIKYNKQGFIQPLLQTAFFTEDWVTSRGFCGGRWWKYYVFISCIFEIFKFLAICWYKINTDESNFSTIDTITFYLNFQELSLKLNQKMELWLQWNGSHLLAAWTSGGCWIQDRRLREIGLTLRSNITDKPAHGHFIIYNTI